LEINLSEMDNSSGEDQVYWFLLGRLLGMQDNCVCNKMAKWLGTISGRAAFNFPAMQELKSNDFIT
jgi:hypothetical protein